MVMTNPKKKQTIERIGTGRDRTAVPTGAKERKGAENASRQIRFWMFPQASPRRTTTHPQKTGITTGGTANGKRNDAVSPKTPSPSA